MIDLPSCNKKWVWSLIFIRIPKNASTSMYYHLGNLNLIKKHEEDFQLLYNQPLYKQGIHPTHAKPNEISLIFRNMVHQHVSFAIVRNPWDRIVSFYQSIMQNLKEQELERLCNLYKINFNLKSSFNDFCEIIMDKYEKKQEISLINHDQCSWLEGMFEPNFILSFENLKEDFAKMLDICNIKHIDKNIPHENSTKRKPYQEYYNDQSIKIIEKIFERDIDKFKYSY